MNKMIIVFLSSDRKISISSTARNPQNVHRTSKFLIIKTQSLSVFRQPRTSYGRSFLVRITGVQVSISIERPASTQKVRPMIGRPADVQIWSFNGSSEIGTRWTTAGYIKIGTPVKGKKLDVYGMSVTYNKRINRKWTIGYPMDVLWIMCASREVRLG